MNTIKILFLTTLFVLLQSCGNKESDTTLNKDPKKEISTKFSKKKKHETNKKVVVKVEAKIKDKKFIFGEVDTTYNSVVVLFKNSFQIRYVDTNDKLVLVHFYASNVYKAPNSFSQQIASLPQMERTNIKVKSSKLVLKFPNKDKSMWSYNTELYEGEVQLKEFTEDKIIINFKGKGYPYGDNNAKGKLLRIDGKIIIENYYVYDAR
jgi:hypothetical protein